MPEAMPKYETERIRVLRSEERSRFESEELDIIEKHGSMILHVQYPDEPRPGFSYTIGLYNTRQTPELITCGLSTRAALAALNHAADLLADGVVLTTGRHHNVIGNVDVEFRPVDRMWIEVLMLSAVWFNGNADFSALQLVFPDLENRFPEDNGFDPHFDQPLLQLGAPMRQIEEDFWDEHAPAGKFYKWRFPCSPRSQAYVSKAVHDAAEPVTFVSHDADDGAWQFIGDTDVESVGVALVCLHHPIDSDPSLKELADLPRGWCAERGTPGEPWIRSEFPSQDETAG